MTTVLWAGSEDTSFSKLTGSIFSNVTSSGFRAAFCRAGMLIQQVGGTTFPPPVYAQSPLLSSIASFWFHARYSNFIGGDTSTVAADNMLVLLDAGGVARLAVQGTGTAGQLKIVTRNAAGSLTTLVTTAPGTLPLCLTGAPVAIDLFVNYAVSGQATLFINGALVADTGAGVNITTDGATALAQCQISSPTSTTNMMWSELLIQDTSTLGCAVQTLPPIAAGNTQAWSPNTVSNVNPTTINDTNFVGSATAAQISEWTLATALPGGSWTIGAVVQEARVSVGSTGPQHFGWEVRTSDGTDHTTGTIAPLVGSFANFQNVWATNPHTSAAWNAGELINAGLVSLA
jgi:hypothetical protein